MTELEQKIWGLCGSPTKAWCGNCEKYVDSIDVDETLSANNDLCSTCKYRIAYQKIDIGLAHVMRLLGKNMLPELFATMIMDIQDNYLVLSYKDVVGDYEDGSQTVKWYEIRILLTTENNEAALLHDQSEETQRAILEAAKNDV
jgi:hypothetical protein